MKRVNFIPSLLVLGFAAISVAQTSIATKPIEKVHYSGSELRKLTREAHTPEQYHRLADYYAQQHAQYQEQAASQKLLWESRSLNTSGPAAKFPRPVDSAKNLYEYYAYETNRTGTLANHYQQLESSNESSLSH